MSSGFNNVALVEGVAYTFTQCAIVIRGQRIWGVTSIEYGLEQNKANNFGPGKFPVSRGHGEIDGSGSLDLDQDTVVKLTDMAPNRRLPDLEPFEIVVTYKNQKRLVVDTLHQCEFNDHGVSSSQGDTRNNRPFPIIIADITFG